MKLVKWVYCILLTGTLSAAGMDPASAVEKLSRNEMAAVIEFLSHDLLEGRAPGTRGGDLAEAYMAGLFKFMGLQPGAGQGGYYQAFNMSAYNCLALEGSLAGKKLVFREDFIGHATLSERDFSVSGPLVFSGFGIRAPQWAWDDYAEVDVRDKVLIVRVNDPGLVHPEIFEGRILTYFGRWVYKLEEAARRGARAVLLVHTDAGAGYDWNVVLNSWSGESLLLENSPLKKLQFMGWIREKSLRQALDGIDVDLDELYRRSEKPGFRAEPLGADVEINGSHELREVTARNVIGVLPGRSEETIVLSAHIDHFGPAGPEAGGGYFNGAIDNASAVAAMTMVAKVLLETGYRSHYTLMFLACQAEESGLLGSYHFVEQADRAKLIANLNFESTPVWEPSLDFFGVGARFSSLEASLKKVLARENLDYSEFSMEDRGFFYRSDQFPFARFGIPAVWLSAGEKSVSGRNHIFEFFTGPYHTVKDEFDPEWELEGLRQTVKVTVGLIEELNREKRRPQWKDKLTFPLEESAGLNNMEKK